ncbi:hypothetical protein INS49_015792 [Diaporthe citri]|uniref:uncharacterized protein n=1 Tax=Diaporthe citri TaxID=83186 RepID=UPI001C7E7A07|nr:uncharacterized protein INS49_015792 [Diaporthe citri]KAG6356404.1 hypothetical protein INS49_015792 [Diaporthe citri]
MASSVALTPSFHPFPRLPYELRLAIIEEYLQGIGYTKSSLRNWRPTVLEDGIITAFQTYGPPEEPLARYATIDKQWKSVVEKHTFHTLALNVAGIDDPNVLDDLERICVGDRIDEISEIELSIVVDNIGSQYSGSSTDLMNAATDQGSEADTDDDTEPSIVHAERVATAAIGHFFRIVAGWTRGQESLILRFKFFCQGPRRSRPLNVTRLAIDSSSFPEVLCIGSLYMPEEGSYWIIKPESTFQLLTRLPNVKRSSMKFHDDDLASPDIIKIVQEGSSTPSFLGSKLSALCLRSTAVWHEKHDPSLYTHPSLQLSQSIFSMTSRLEELYIGYVVDLSAFLRQACIVSRSTPRSTPAWPNLRILLADGVSGSSPSDDRAVAAEFYDSVTEALPHMPNITMFEVELTSPFHVNERLYWDNATISIRVPPRDDRSATRDGELVLCGAEPDQYTVDAWQQIARRQWHCKLTRVSCWSSPTL